METRTILEKFDILFNKSDLIATRFMLAIGALLWAVMLLIPNNTFDRPMFTIVKQVMPEEFWGILFLIQGMAALYALFGGTRRKILIFVDSVLGCFLWTSITAGMIFSTLTANATTSAPAAASSSIVLTLASCWVLARYPKSNQKSNIDD